MFAIQGVLIYPPFGVCKEALIIGFAAALCEMKCHPFPPHAPSSHAHGMSLAPQQSILRFPVCSAHAFFHPVHLTPFH